VAQWIRPIGLVTLGAMVMVISAGCGGDPAPPAASAAPANEAPLAAGPTAAAAPKPAGAAPAAAPGQQRAACDETRGWGTSTEESAPYTDIELYNVRAGQHACYDRVVFDVNGADPVGYHVRYVPTVLSDGAGEQVPVAGRAALEVIVHAPDFAAASSGHQPGRPAWTVGQLLVDHTGWKALKEVRFAGGFEGQTTFAVGVNGERPFRVLTVRDDAVRHVVVDIAH
jgi:hypothetical protein